MSRTWNTGVVVEHTGSLTTAHVELTGRDGLTLHAEGRAHRNPSDAPMPEIGEELAVARALYAMADRLQEVADRDVANLAHHG